jgi:hypothetical protein
MHSNAKKPYKVACACQNESDDVGRAVPAEGSGRRGLPYTYCEGGLCLLRNFVCPTIVEHEMETPGSSQL